MNKSLLTADFMRGLQSVLGVRNIPVSLHEPEFRGNEWIYVKECLDSGWVSSVGKYVDEFEQHLATYVGSKHAVAVGSGTAALHAALLAVGVKAGDEVLIPTLSFVATANSVAHCGAIPHFVDSEERTLGLNPDALREYLLKIAEPSSGGFRNRLSGRRLAAVVPMHTFGHPVNMDDLLKVARDFKLLVIEDAAESLGSFLGDKHTGTFGQAGIFSFNGNKIITTGGGGAIVTNDTALARYLKHITTTAKQPHAWEFSHDQIAYNYRLPNINAALGCAQLEKLPEMLVRKRNLATRYKDSFSNFSGGHFVVEPEGSCSNFWLNTICLTVPDNEIRDMLLREANNKGYNCRPAWRLLHHLPMFQDSPRAPLPIAENLQASLINLPSSPSLEEKKDE